MSVMRHIWAMLLPIAACAPGLPDPEPRAVVPAWGWNGEATDVEIRGEDFFPRMQAAGADAVSVDRQFQVWLEGDERVDLDGVTFAGEGTLRARVPAGVDAGLYGLVVEGPGGQRGRLSGAFTVTDSRADHIEVSATDVSWPVNSLARVDLQLADPTGADVPEVIEVEVMFRGVDDPSTLHFEQTLDDQTLFYDTEFDQVGLRGALGPDGQGHLTFTSGAPADLWLDVAAAGDDAFIAGASQFLSFTPAAASALIIEPVDPDAPLVAGEPFDLRVTLVDEFGNPATEAAAAITLFESCGSPTGRWSDSATFVGSTVLRDVSLHGATEAGGGITCERSVIEAVGNVLGTTVTGASEPLAVAPGPVRSYALDVWPPSVVAGEGGLVVWTEALDQHENRVLVHDAPITLSDSVGGLTGAGSASCSAFAAGMARCDGTPVVAGPSITLRVDDAAGREGVASGLTVLPAAPSALTISAPTGSVSAGVPFAVLLQATDPFNNGVTLDINGVDQAAFTDGSGAVGCGWQSTEAATATERFTCIATRANPDTVLNAAIPFRGLLAESQAFAVTNGPLDSVTVSAGVGSVTAGVPLAVGVQAYDAFGNPYRVQTTSSLTLTDSAGDLSGQVVTLNSAGVGTASVVLTTAVEGTQVSALSSGVVFGSSTPFDVTAATPVGLVVEVDRTWAWLDDPIDLSVTAVDTYNNPVPSYSGAVTLSSLADAGAVQAVSGFSGGVAQATFSWDTPSLQDQLSATDGSLSGLSGAIDAVEPCTDGPEADLTVGGDTTLVVCRSGGVTPATTLSTAGTTEGEGALTATHFAPEPGVWSRVAGTSTSHTWDRVGTWEVEALVVDDNACGDLVSAQVWSADNDGEAAGPLTLSTDQSALVAGSSTSGATTVTLEATDCAGDPAAGATVLVRADLGTLASGTSTVASTGDGLAVLLDGDGVADLLWSVVGERHAGTATLVAGREGAEAYGDVSVAVSGDAARPTVVDITPVGTTNAQFSDVEASFSEPLLASSVSASTVTLTDPFGVPIGVSPSLSADQTVVTLSLPAARDAGSGVWTLELSSNLRDAAGNRLAGQYTSSSAPLQLDFGAVSNTAPDVLSCAASTAVFRPDGDPGTGAAADSVSLTAVASSAPSWWEVEVTHSSGDLVYLSRLQASGATRTLTWSGRGQDGFIQPNGDYVLTVAALDASWNAGATCSQTVALSNRVPVAE